MNIDLESLKAILREIRDDKYPNIPDSLIDSILLSASEHQDDKSASVKEIKSLIDDYINAK